MELSPRDLGTERYLAVMRRRLTPVAGTHNGISTLNLDEEEEKNIRQRPWRGRGRRLRRYWVKDLQLDDETAERLSGALWRGGPGLGTRVASIIISIYLFIPFMISLAAQAPAFVAPLIICMWGLIMWSIARAPRAAVRKLHQKKVTTTEIDSLLPTARGRLERTYLNLVGDALRQDIPSESARSDIRAALRDLGDAVSRLPAEPVPTAEPAQLRREADEQRVLAQAEPDSFVRASLLRQAEAHERRAALGAQTALSARRLSALRREARGQMDALRSVLVAFERTSQTDAAAVAHLSDTVARVAQEAQAVSIARRELEEGEIAALLGHALPEAVPPQPILPARKIITGNGSVPTQPVEQPAPQIVQTRNWWRNQS